MPASKPSPEEVEDFLVLIDFPKSKNKLLEQAKELDLPEDIINVLRQLPDKNYSSIKSVMDVLSNLNPALFQDLSRG